MTPGAPVTTPWIATVSDTDGPVSVRLALQLADPPTPDQVAFWGEVLGTFFHCAEQGCFCSGTVTPSAEDLVVDHAELALSISTRVSGVDSSAWQVFIGMVLAAGRYFMPVTSFQLTVQSATPVPVLDGPKLIAKPYPGLRKLPFPVDDRRGGPSNPTVNRGVDVHARAAFPSEDFDRIAALLEAWSEVANGGYPGEDRHPVENACDPAGAQPLGDSVVEFAIPNFLGDEAAFDALLNGLAHIHGASAMVRHVVLR